MASVTYGLTAHDWISSRTLHLYRAWDFLYLFKPLAPVSVWQNTTFAQMQPLMYFSMRLHSY